MNYCMNNNETYRRKTLDKRYHQQGNHKILKKTGWNAEVQTNKSSKKIILIMKGYLIGDFLHVISLGLCKSLLVWWWKLLGIWLTSFIHKLWSWISWGQKRACLWSFWLLFSIFPLRVWHDIISCTWHLGLWSCRWCCVPCQVTCNTEID